ncbi:uncharacterized protein RHO17_021195 [Thomomys bottae]
MPVIARLFAASLYQAGSQLEGLGEPEGQRANALLLSLGRRETAGFRPASAGWAPTQGRRARGGEGRGARAAAPPRWARASLNREPRARSPMPSAAAEGGASRKDAECCKLAVQPRAGEASCRLGRERRLRVYWLNSPVSAAERAAAKGLVRRGAGERAGRPQSLRHLQYQGTPTPAYLP